MAIGLTDDKHYNDIATALRTNGPNKDGTFRPEDMASEVGYLRNYCYGLGRDDAWTEAQSEIQGSYNSGYKAGYEVGKAEGGDTEAAYQQGLTAGIEQGKKAEWSAFWYVFQEDGKRTNYTGAFGSGYFKDAIFKPKYDIRPVGPYGGGMFRESSLTNLKQLLVDAGVVLDTSQCTHLLQTFQSSNITHLPEIDASIALNTSYMIGSKCRIATVDKLIVSEKTPLDSTFNNAIWLVNIIFEGEIGKSVDLHWSNLLTLESAKSCLLCLKNFTGTGNEYSCTVSFHADTWALLDADNTAPGGVTWREYVMDTLSWNI